MRLLRFNGSKKHDVVRSPETVGIRSPANWIPFLSSALTSSIFPSIINAPGCARDSLPEYRARWSGTCCISSSEVRIRRYAAITSCLPDYSCDLHSALNWHLSEQTPCTDITTLIGHQRSRRAIYEERVVPAGPLLQYPCDRDEPRDSRPERGRQLSLQDFPAVAHGSEGSRYNGSGGGRHLRLIPPLPSVPRLLSLPICGDRDRTYGQLCAVRSF